MTPGAIITLCACAFSLGAVLALFVMAECATRQLAARDEDHKRATKRLHDESAYWKAQAARYRAAIDGAAGYSPTPRFPRSLNRR